MDWQHLIMNGEHLPEYAALLASEGLLGHLHANSGWGTFDDDNMVGATAFMETLELALELRRCGYGAGGERLGFDLYPYTEDQVGAVRRSVLQWRFIDSVAAKIDDAALREAQQAKDAVRAYEIVYAALGARPRDHRWSGSTSAPPRSRASRSTPDGAVLARAEAGYPLSTPRPGWAEQDPEDWWQATESVLSQLRAAPAPPTGSGSRGQMHGLVALDSSRPRPAPGDPLERPAHGRRVRRDRGDDRPRAADRADRQPRAARFHRAEAAVAAPP